MFYCNVVVEYWCILADHGACNLDIDHIYERLFFFQSDSEKIENIEGCCHGDNFSQSGSEKIVMAL